MEDEASQKVIDLTKDEEEKDSTTTKEPIPGPWTLRLRPGRGCVRHQKKHPSVKFLMYGSVVSYMYLYRVAHLKKLFLEFQWGIWAGREMDRLGHSLFRCCL